MEENFVMFHAVEWRMDKSFFDIGAESPIFSLYGIRWKLKLQITTEEDYRNVTKTFFKIRLMVIDTSLNNLDAKFSVYYRWKRRNGVRTQETYVNVSFSDLITNVGYIITDSKLSSLLNRLYRVKIISDAFSADNLYFVCSIRPNSDDQVSLQMHKEQFPTVSLPCIDRLARDFEKAFSSSEHTDVILKCGDKSIPAHKAILSCRSEVFQAMFRNNLKESQEGIVDIMDVEQPVFEKLIHYIYTGNLTVETMKSVCNIYKAAHKYSIEALKQRCIHFIKGNLETDQACEVLIMADLYQDSELKLFVMTYIIYRKEFMLSDQWLTFSKDHPSLAQEVFLLFVQKAKVV